MWIKSYSKWFKNLKKEEVWRAWIDVNNRHKWDLDTEYAKLEQPFAVGSEFVVKPKDFSIVKMILTEVEPNYKFTDCTKFFGATLYGTHEMLEEGDGLRLTTTIKITGPLCFVWRKIVGEDIVRTLPEQTDLLVGYITNGQQN
jgi:hypothetical protein